MNDMRKPDTAARAADRTPDPTALLSEMLTAHALSLDAIYTDLIGNAADNMTKWPGAAQAYARLAFRAQSNCRTSLQAAARAERELQRIEGDAKK